MTFRELFKIVPTAYKVVLKLFGTFQVIYFLCKLFEYFENGMEPNANSHNKSYSLAVLV